MTLPSKARFQSLLRFQEQSALFVRPWAKRLWLILGVIGIVAWQSSFWAQGNRLDEGYRLEASTGMFTEEVREFMYFYYYLGLFPVITAHRPLMLSAEGARRIFEEHGDKLLMEYNYSVRYGDYGRFFLFLSDAWRKGRPEDLSPVLCNGFFFVLALAGMFIGLTLAGQPVLGAVLVLLFGSNPFQLFEVYGHENVFGWYITTALLILAVNGPLLFREKGWEIGRYPWIAAALSGIILGSVRHIRPEPLPLILGPVIACALLPGARWARRLQLLLMLLAAYSGTSGGLNLLFHYKIEEARSKVAAVGGHPIPEQMLTPHHTFWHPFFCGLGDFDQKYGFTWDDRVGYRYAYPLMKAQYGFPLTYRAGYYLEETYDPEGLYPIKLEEIGLYEQVLKDKVLGTIADDPLWYGGILGRRLLRILTQTTPVRVALGTWHMSLPFPGVFAVAVFLGLIWLKGWPLVKLILFFAPLSTTSLLIYSGGNSPLYSCYHLAAAGIVLAFLVEAILQGRNTRKSV